MNFLGLHTNADPHDIKPGETVSQINFGGSIDGKLRTRSGLIFVSFSGGNGGTSNNVTVGFPYNTPFGDFIVYQRANGDVIAGKAPA